MTSLVRIASAVLLACLAVSVGFNIVQYIGSRISPLQEKITILENQGMELIETSKNLKDLKAEYPNARYFNYSWGKFVFYARKQQEMWHYPINIYYNRNDGLLFFFYAEEIIRIENAGICYYLC